MSKFLCSSLQYFSLQFDDSDCRINLQDLLLCSSVERVWDKERRRLWKSSGKPAIQYHNLDVHRNQLWIVFGTVDKKNFCLDISTLVIFTYFYALQILHAWAGNNIHRVWDFGPMRLFPSLLVSLIICQIVDLVSKRCSEKFILAHRFLFCRCCGKINFSSL